MSVELISVLVLVGIFAIATVTRVHMGALGLVAAFLVGVFAVGESTDDILSGFPGDLFAILVGVTLLFAIAKSNGTVDWLVQSAVRTVGGRAAAIPWVMFVITAAMTAVGSVVPAAIAIVAPIAMGFAKRYRINPLLMGLLVVNGSNAGGFSPISIYGGIINGVLNRNHLPGNSGLLFGIAFLFNTVLSVIVYLVFGGRALLRSNRISIATAAHHTAAHEPADSPQRAGGAEPQSASGNTAVGTRNAADEPENASDGGTLTLNRDRSLTLLGIVALLVFAEGFGLDVGLVAITVAVVLAFLSPEVAKNAVNQVAWSTVLLICGIVTYVALLQHIGTVNWLGAKVAAIGAPLLAALIICYIGGVVSAFASTTGILGALIPLAVPFLSSGAVGAVGMVIALAISSSVVDSSPFSTSGALCVANTAEDDRDAMFRRLMAWGFTMIALAPPVIWVILVVPGWL